MFDSSSAGVFGSMNSNSDNNTKDMVRLLNKLENDIKNWESKYDGLSTKVKRYIDENKGLEKDLSILKQENCD